MRDVGHVFSDTQNATLYVPAESIEAYKTTDPWQSFGTIVALSGDGIDAELAIKKGHTSVTDVFDISGRATSEYSGIRIIRMSDGTTQKVLLK